MPNYMEHGIPMSTGFDLNAQRPLDHREVVQTYEDLINMPDIKKYIGLRVYVINDDIMYKLNKDKKWIANDADWSLISGAPDNNDVKEGQIYLDISTGNLYKGIENPETGIAEWVLQAKLKGEQGITGDKGDTGERGSKWFTGTTITGGSSIANKVFSSSGITSCLKNDMYLNEDTSDVYVCTLGGGSSQATWSYSCNIKGLTGNRGIRGSNWYSGTKINDDSGNIFIATNSGLSEVYVNDMYINTNTCDIYQCVTSGNAQTAQWKYITTLRFTGASISEYTNQNYPELVTIKQALDLLLYIPLELTLSYSHSLTQEKGTVVSGFIINWEYSGNGINSQSMNGEDIGVNARSYTAQNQISSNTTFVFEYNDGKDVTKKINLQFLNGIYYGASSSTVYNTNLISSLNKKLQSNNNITVTIDAGDDEYIYFACPSSYGTPKFVIGILETTFVDCGVIEHTNSSNYTESYNLYRSTYPGLGKTTINITKG